MLFSPQVLEAKSSSHHGKKERNVHCQRYVRLELGHEAGELEYICSSDIINVEEMRQVSS